MNKENRLLVTDNPVEFEKYQLTFKTSVKLLIILEESMGFVPKKYIKKIRRSQHETSWTGNNRMDFDRLRPKISPGTG